LVATQRAAFFFAASFFAAQSMAAIQEAAFFFAAIFFAAYLWLQFNLYKDTRILSNHNYGCKYFKIIRSKLGFSQQVTALFKPVMPNRKDKLV
jgi:hypothetical protein